VKNRGGLAKRSVGIIRATPRFYAPVIGGFFTLSAVVSTDEPSVKHIASGNFVAGG